MPIFESNNTDSEDNAFVKQVGAFSSGVMTEVSLDDSSWTALPSSALSDRVFVSVQYSDFNAGKSKQVLLNYSNSAASDEGIRLGGGDIWSRTISDSITIYGRVTSGSADVIVEEIS